MTKKRFKNVGKDIFQYGEWWCGAKGEHCADVIATALNELIDYNVRVYEENEQLKQQLTDWETSYELLKEEKRQLLKVIDDKLNELENDYERGVKAGMPTMSIYSEIELLESLKKEVFE